MNPVDDLREFRTMLVAERRRELRSTLETREANRGEGGESRGAVIRIYQEQIEAVDRAITDELKLAADERVKASTETAPEPTAFRDS